MKLFDDVGFGKVDIMREKLKGFPEIIYGEYKTVFLISTPSIAQFF